MSDLHLTSSPRVNGRTGRVIFYDPDPPPAQTYLEKRNVSAHLQTVERNPASSEATYRRATTAILRWLFREEDGFDVIQEDDRGSSIPDHVVFKIECRAGGSFYAYDFMMVECKQAGESWAAAIEHCTRHCENTHDESGNVYGMVQVGLDVQFYQWENTTLSPVSGVLHLRDDVRLVLQWADYLKAHPLSVV